MKEEHPFYEFFSGGGMARLGLGKGWRCVFANDIDEKKAASYRHYFGGNELIVEDVGKISVRQLSGRAALAWASFPCQDLSLAGGGAGLSGKRSGTFWPFWNLMRALGAERRAPKVIVLENVYGAITSHEGRDFAAIAEALTTQGYLYGPVVIDAALFLPQSRPRLFVVAAHESLDLSNEVVSNGPHPQWHPSALELAYAHLSVQAMAQWIWWKLPYPSPRKHTFGELIEVEPADVLWHTRDETERLLQMMSPANRAKVEIAKRVKRRMVGGLYKRTRIADGIKVQRAEVRFDDMAGCLRTPAGGSSRQTILIVEGTHVCSRLLSPREAARLMGLPDDYSLPVRYNDAYHLAGDGVAVPVVRFIAEHLLEKILQSERVTTRLKAA